MKKMYSLRKRNFGRIGQGGVDVEIVCNEAFC